MKRFLKETWELWYWAMFCPSRLQQRVNAWSVEKDDAAFVKIMLFSINWRFVGQFFSLVGFLSLPLIGVLIKNSAPLDWLLLPITVITAHGLGLWFVSAGIHIPP
ncbi:MAG: hypothetical protein ACFB0C_13155 [Leptolyngbyaceae cyanobacterium]